GDGGGVSGGARRALDDLRQPAAQCPGRLRRRRGDRPAGRGARCRGPQSDGAAGRRLVGARDFPGGDRAARERARTRAGPRPDARVAGTRGGAAGGAAVEEGCRRLLPGAAGMTFVVCEDGAEYTERFRRFLGSQFRFVRAGHFAEALALADGAVALLLDLDFRRTQPALLVDERGESGARSTADVQGILILRALRARGVTLPALLFADLDDAERAARL